MQLFPFFFALFYSNIILDIQIFCHVCKLIDLEFLEFGLEVIIINFLTLLVDLTLNI